MSSVTVLGNPFGAIFSQSLVAQSLAKRLLSLFETAAELVGAVEVAPFFFLHLQLPEPDFGIADPVFIAIGDAPIEGRIEACPTRTQLGEPRGNPDQPLPEFVEKNRLSNVEDKVAAVSDGLLPDATTAVLIPLAEFGKNALAKNAEERYQTGAEMAQALRQCMASRETVDITI